MNAALRLSAEAVEAAEHANELPFDPGMYHIRSSARLAVPRSSVPPTVSTFQLVPGGGT